LGDVLLNTTFCIGRMLPIEL